MLSLSVALKLQTHFNFLSKADNASRFEFRFRSRSTISCLFVRTCIEKRRFLLYDVFNRETFFALKCLKLLFECDVSSSKLFVKSQVSLTFETIPVWIINIRSLPGLRPPLFLSGRAEFFRSTTFQENAEGKNNNL